MWKLILLAVSIVSLAISLTSTNWWAVAAASGVVIAAIRLSFPDKLPWLVIPAAVIAGATLMNPIYENPPDPRWEQVRSLAQFADGFSWQYPARQPNVGESAEGVVALVREAHLRVQASCVMTLPQNLSNIWFGFFKARFVPPLATLVTDRIDLKADTDACFDRARDLGKLVPEYQQALKYILNSPTLADGPR